MGPRILVASNGHKDYLSPGEASAAIARGLRREGVPVTLAPVADGGDGTIEALVAARRGQVVQVPTHDALFRPRMARLGVYEGVARTAVIEIAEAAGSALLRRHERQTMIATSYGVGELILEAVARSCFRIVIGLGGSIVSDMGIGMAQALGVEFLDRGGEVLTPIANQGFNSLSLRDIAGLRLDGLRVQPEALEILVASDVAIPLLGPGGQARTFGPQKGASEEEIRYLDQGFSDLAAVVARSLGRHVDVPLAGAAGGLGAGLLAFCGARLALGAEVVADEIGLEGKMKEHDVVIIGEGCLDRTTLLQKAPFFAGSLAKRLDRYVIGIVGMVKEAVEPVFYHELFVCQPDGAVAALAKPVIEAQLEATAGRVADALAQRCAAAARADLPRTGPTGART